MALSCTLLPKICTKFIRRGERSLPSVICFTVLCSNLNERVVFQIFSPMMYRKDIVPKSFRKQVKNIMLTDVIFKTKLI